MTSNPHDPRDQSRQRAAIRSLLPLAFTIGLFALSSIPGESAHDGASPLLFIFSWVTPTLQNLLHIPAFATLAWLWFRALQPLSLPLPTTLAIGLGLTLGYALVDEWRQAFVPGRYPSATDLVADGTGAIIVALIYRARYGANRQ